MNPHTMKTRSNKREKALEYEDPLSKRAKRKLKYSAASLLEEQATTREEEGDDIPELLTPPHTNLSLHVSPVTANVITIAQNSEYCLLSQIPKSVSLEVLSYLDSENFAHLESTNRECLELTREEVATRIRSLYETYHIPLSQFSETNFWDNKWWLANVVTGRQFESPATSFESTRALLGHNGLSSPSPSTHPFTSPTTSTITSAMSPNGSHLSRSASKVLDMFKDERVLRRDLYGCGETFLENMESKFKKSGTTRPVNRACIYKKSTCLIKNKKDNNNSCSSSHSSSSSSSSSAVEYSTSLTPRSNSSERQDCKAQYHGSVLCPNGISHDWLRELNKWDTAYHVPRDGSLEEVIEMAPPGSHIILAPGVHVLSDLTTISSSLQIIGSLNEKNMPSSVIRASHGVFRVNSGAHLGLFGVGIWCYSSDFTRRNAITVETKSTLFASYCQIKCVSGRYCGGMLVQAEASALLCDCTISACTGSGVILFGVGQFEHCEFFDNHFNGIEVQKGGEAYMTCCHVHSNGYCSNDEDLGSGVTCCGSTSLVWMRDSFIHSNQGGGLIVQSSAKAIAQGCQMSMNHAGHEFGDLDVDTESDVVLEHCLLRGNGQHGREQYSVVCAQRNCHVSLRHCYVSCNPASFGTGIDVQNGAVVDLTSCEVFQCSGSGVLLRDPNVTVHLTRSKLHDNKLHGVEVQAGEVMISDCDISDNLGHDIYISETNGECKYRISKTSASSFSAVSDERKHLLLDQIAGTPFSISN